MMGLLTTLLLTCFGASRWDQSSTGTVQEIVRESSDTPSHLSRRLAAAGFQRFVCFGRPPASTSNTNRLIQLALRYSF
jgi:hypothetical protein